MSPPEAEGQPPTVTGSAKDRIAQNLTKNNHTEQRRTVDNFERIQYTRNTRALPVDGQPPAEQLEVIAELVRVAAITSFYWPG